MGIVLLIVFAAPGPDLHTRAIQAFERSEFVRAAELLRFDLQHQLGRTEERRTRELLVLSLFNAEKRDEALAVYNELIERFPDFAFNEEEVLPDTITFFKERAPKPKPKPQPPPEITKPAAQPVELKQAATSPATLPVVHEKRFRWYYLMPLGIGQYAAGSPVRGTIFLILQAGFLAMNLIGYFALYQPQQLPDDSSIDPQRARTGMLLTNTGFAGLLGSVIAGIIDAAAFERN